jgi:hypothetical protein
MNHVLRIIAGTAPVVIGAEEAKCEVIRQDREFEVSGYAAQWVEYTIWKKF